MFYLTITISLSGMLEIASGSVATSINIITQNDNHQAVPDINVIDLITVVIMNWEDGSYIPIHRMLAVGYIIVSPTD